MGERREFLAVSLLFAVALQASSALRCDRTPEGTTAPRTIATDNRYVIEVSGNPETYVPGEQYTIFLRSNPDFTVPHKFKDFFLFVEHEQSEKTLGDVKNPSVGTLQLYGDMLTKFSDKCRNAVTATNSLPKFEIQVLWSAPPPGSGCVALRATVAESREVWYSEDGPLSKVLCEEVQENEDIQPNILRHCCACDEAKYEVTFEGLWSRNTHPKDFPTNGWLTKFSDIIGASHTVNYTFWNYGDIASEGLRQLAENGATRMLESELKAKSEHIRTIIKARGITYPNITGKTFAVFRVDNRHHLMSLVSMLAPSPDWIVGVSSLELCLRNCSWVESRTLNLYPYDAGTDDGFTYMSEDKPSQPKQPIRRIKSNSPNDPRSPFYDPTGAEMKPLARLHLSRQRLYEKACDHSMVDMGNDPVDENCELDVWSEWSDCSATCGKGVKYRQRAYKDKEGKGKCKKNVLTMRANCYGAQKHCRSQTHQKPQDPECVLTEWSEWSSCSSTCGKGTQTRSRRYMNRAAAKRCAATLQDPPPLEQNLECERHDGCDNGDIEEEDTCTMPWSEWSPCSASCGKGIKKRYRLPANPIARSVYSYAYKQQNNAYSENDEEEDDAEEEDEEENFRNYNYYHGNDNNGPNNCKKMMETVECIADDMPTCDHEEPDASSCKLPKDVGVCKSNVDRWYFDNIRGKCEIFSFSGCQGNPNNFRTLELCQTICKDYQTSEHPFPGMHAENHYRGPKYPERDGNVMQGATGPVVNCEVSRWSSWSKCEPSNGNCGKGIKSKSRHIIMHPMNGGTSCPKRLMKKRKCKVSCEVDDNDLDESREATLPTWGPGNSVNEIKIDCIMSNWTAWSPCSVSCGLYAVQTRTRSILQHPSGHGSRCPNRVEKRMCNLLACPE